MPDIEQRADVRVVEAGNGAGLGFESRPTVGPFGQFGMQQLDRDDAFEAHVARLVHLSHPADADQRQDLVRAGDWRRERASSQRVL